MENAIIMDCVEAASDSYHINYTNGDAILESEDDSNEEGSKVVEGEFEEDEVVDEELIEEGEEQKEEK